ncbi:MAG: MarR family transcriptional regulator, partial [Dehalococcoidia bacterium]
MAEPPLVLERFLPYRLNRAAEAVSQRFAAVYRSRYGLTRPEWRTLATVGQMEPTTATAIG